MPFDSTKVTYNTAADDAFGSAAYPIVPDDAADQVDADGKYFKYVVAKSAGDVAVLGYKNADGDTAQVFTMAAGGIVPLRVRRVYATGTTATVAGVSR